MTEEVKPIYWLEIPDGRSIPFNDLPRVLADAMWPDMGDDDERLEYGLAELSFEKSLKQAAESGALTVRSMITGERYTFDRTVILSRGMVMPEQDLAPYLKASGSLIGIRRAPPPGMTYLDKGETAKRVDATPSTSADSKPDVQIPQTKTTQSNSDRNLLASPTELISAFGAFTGMDASWFDNLKDVPALLKARRVKGKGQRPKIEPLFCSYEVVQWLIDPKRRKGRSMTPATGWRMLEKHFPKAYAVHSINDPRTD